MSEMVKELHVVMVPWSAFGHLMPFFQLSIALAKSKVHVSFISTPKIIERLPKIPSELQPFIDLVSVSFPPLEPGFLPEGGEASIDVPVRQYANLQVAVDLLEAPIREFIVDKKPDWIVADWFSHWIVDIAEECHVPLAFFSVFSAATIVYFGPPEYLTGEIRNGELPTVESLMSQPKWVPFPSLLALKEYEAVKRLLSWDVNKTGSCFAWRLAKIVSGSRVVAIRTCCEIEGDYLEVYKNITGKPVIPTGILPPDQPRKRAQGKMSSSDAAMFDWLDKQESRSVVFVGFGSECRLTKEQVHEMAHGLELSKLPFIWGLRKPNSTRNDDEDDPLPSGFVEKTSEKGIVCFGWVPQMEILAHSSIGGALFHSGWGSVIEILQFGHSLVVLPFMYDQPLNARLLVEKELAVEVKRNEDGSFTGEEVAKSLRLAMVDEEGEKLRSNVRKAAAVICDEKLQRDHYLATFVDYLKNNVEK